jgi:FlaA1/EpsC-like NDP-sugar epimerase
MGDPVSVLELAHNLLALSGYDPDNGDEGPGIEIIGLRPGERLHESLIAPDEVLSPSPNPLIKKARTRQPIPFDASAALASLVAPAVAGDPHGVCEALAEVVTSYSGSQAWAREG